MQLDDLLLIVESRRRGADGSARAIRLAAGAKLTEVAAVCGVDESAVSRWETGKTRPRGEAALKYARLLVKLQADTKRTRAAA